MLEDVFQRIRRAIKACANSIDTYYKESRFGTSISTDPEYISDIQHSEILEVARLERQNARLH